MNLKERILEIKEACDMEYLSRKQVEDLYFRSKREEIGNDSDLLELRKEKQEETMYTVYREALHAMVRCYLSFQFVYEQESEALAQIYFAHEQRFREFIRRMNLPKEEVQMKKEVGDFVGFTTSLYEQLENER